MRGHIQQRPRYSAAQAKRVDIATKRFSSILADGNPKLLEKQGAQSKDGKVDFSNKSLLREILRTCPNFTWDKTTYSDFPSMSFDHPKFEGSGQKLIKKTFGLETLPDHEIKAEDYQNFLFYVFEDELCSDIVIAEDRFTELNPHLQQPCTETALDIRFRLQALREALGGLSLLDRKILELHYGIGQKSSHKLSDVADLCGRSYNDVWHRKEVAIRILRSRGVGSSRFGVFLIDRRSGDEMIKSEIKMAMDPSVPPYVRDARIDEIIAPYSDHSKLPLWREMAANTLLGDKTRLNVGRKLIGTTPSFYGLGLHGLHEREKQLRQIANNPNFIAQVRSEAMHAIVVSYREFVRDFEISPWAPTPRIPKYLDGRDRKMVVDAWVDTIKKKGTRELGTIIKDAEVPEEVREAAGMKFMERASHGAVISSNLLFSLASDNEVSEKVRKAAIDAIGRADSVYVRGMELHYQRVYESSLPPYLRSRFATVIFRHYIKRYHECIRYAGERDVSDALSDAFRFLATQSWIPEEAKNEAAIELIEICKTSPAEWRAKRVVKGVITHNFPKPSIEEAHHALDGWNEFDWTGRRLQKLEDLAEKRMSSKKIAKVLGCLHRHVARRLKKDVYIRRPELKPVKKRSN